MLEIAALCAFFLLGVMGAILLLAWMTNRLTRSLLTDHFRAAEYIVQQHRPPPDWKIPRSADERIMRVQLLRHMDTLIRFFQTCPYFEDEETRALLLTQLDEMRQHWQVEAIRDLLPR